MSRDRILAPASAQARKARHRGRRRVFQRETAPGLGRFDAVHLSNVLECAPDPINIAILARDLLDRAACFASTCRTISRRSRSPDAPPSARKNGGSPRRYHLNYFDFESAAGLLERLGLEIVERTTSFPMEAFLMMGDDYTKDRDLGRACHKKRKRFDLALEAAGLKETRRAFYRALANSGMGREVVLIAVKP